MSLFAITKVFQLVCSCFEFVDFIVFKSHFPTAQIERRAFNVVAAAMDDVSFSGGFN